MDDTQHPSHSRADSDRTDDLGLPPPDPESLAIRTAEDILAYLPHALGEWPHESLVAVSLAAGHLGPTLRIDLPARRGRSSLERFAETVADYMAHGAPVGAVLAVYTHAEWQDPGRPPHRAAVDAVVSRLAEAGIPVLEVWIVGREHWRTASCTDPSCCPWPGASIESLRASRIEAEMVYRGSTYGHRDLGEDHEVELPPAHVAAALEAYVQHPERWWDPLAFSAALAAWDEVLTGPDSADPGRLGLLAATLMRPALRDAVLVASAADAATAWRGSAATAQLRDTRHDGVPPTLPGGVPRAEAAAALDFWGECAAAHTGGPSETSSALEFGLVLMGCTTSPPAWGRIARLERVAMSLARMEEPEVRAPALSILGWIQWARGRGGRSLKYLERALSADPEYRLARLLRRLVEHGELSEWARNKETAWNREAEAA
ncbi:hypothetical protein GCM10027449_32910 [Sinomonas notoginsengisoli]|uniref:DUF4192 domain-containing protein n=1 Tax=Sinomonas notoginsengisoli TaxID=1457311 RepID=UPI001F392A40|nr:DUF4192 domain-containing protein [Sinomonas notoginsengisoli]